jgi:hypothetical protein
MGTATRIGTIPTWETKTILGYSLCLVSMPIRAQVKICVRALVIPFSDVVLPASGLIATVAKKATMLMTAKKTGLDTLKADYC